MALLFSFVLALLLPPSGVPDGPAEIPAVRTHTLVQIAAADGRFDTLVAALKASGLDNTLSGDGPLTVFAPTDAAFAALPSGTLEALLRPENRHQLVSILTYHVISGRITSSDLLSTGSAQTASGVRLPIGLSIGGAAIVQTDITAENGIIHVIDSVLLPPTNDTPVSTVSQMTDSDQRVAREARKTIALAIERGAPLYNAGQERACAAIYEVATTALLTNADLPDRARVALESGLERASRMHGVEDQAWRLREGLDAAYASLGRRMMTSGAGQ